MVFPVIPLLELSEFGFTITGKPRLEGILVSLFTQTKNTGVFILKDFTILFASPLSSVIHKVVSSEPVKGLNSFISLLIAMIAELNQKKTEGLCVI